MLNSVKDSDNSKWNDSLVLHKETWQWWQHMDSDAPSIIL